MENVKDFFKIDYAAVTVRYTGLLELILSSYFSQTTLKCDE